LYLKPPINVNKYRLRPTWRQGRIKPLGKPGKCPGPRAWISKRSFIGFSYFRLFTTRQNCRSFWLLRLVYRSGKLV